MQAMVHLHPEQTVTGTQNIHQAQDVLSSADSNTNQLADASLTNFANGTMSGNKVSQNIEGNQDIQQLQIVADADKSAGSQDGVTSMSNTATGNNTGDSVQDIKGDGEL